jgi:hypothetical protein
MLNGDVLPPGLTRRTPGASWLPCKRSVDRAGVALGTCLSRVTW